MELLEGAPPRTAGELAAMVGATRSEINSELYRRPDAFRHDGSQPRRWVVLHTSATTAPGARVSAVPPPEAISDRFERLLSGLYDWQRRALDDWAAAGHRGVVEAVTGAGKTRVGLTAIGDALSQGLRVLVVVPTTVLLVQWQQEIMQHLGIQAGLLGAGKRAGLVNNEIVVSTVQSASKIEDLLPPSAGGLLVCDEVHRYGADSFARVLQPTFERRLGMTATFERNDGGLDTHLLPYFRKVVYSLGYEEALDEGVIAHFRVAIVRVDLDSEEQRDYDEAHGEARSARYKLTTHHGVPREPFGEFMAEVAWLAEGSPRDEETRLARRFLSNFSESRRILGETRRKLDVLGHISDAVAASQGTLVFASTVEGARRVAQTLTDVGIRSAALDSSMTLKERREVLDRFGRREVLAVAAPLVLDEGVDVPEANLAVILAASKTRRQMIQRLGRVVRSKADGGMAHLALVVARNTSEDPASGAHMGFIDEMLDVADELKVFDAAHLPDLARFLTGGNGGADPDFSSTADVAPGPASLPPDEPQGTAPRDFAEMMEQLRRTLEDLEAASAARERTISAPPRRADRAAPAPLSLVCRVRGQLDKGQRTAAGLANELSIPRPQIVKVLEGSSEFVARGLWWYLRSKAPPPGSTGGSPHRADPPVADPPVANPPVADPPAQKTAHPLIVAWEAAAGPMNAGQRVHFERAMRFVMPTLTDPDEARRFVNSNLGGIRARLQQ